MELFEYPPNTNSMSFPLELTYKAVQKRSDGLLRYLRVDKEVFLVCVTTDIVQSVKIKVFIPVNSPQAASITNWKTLEFSCFISSLQKHKIGLCEGVRQILISKGNLYHDLDESRISFILVFFDADCQPLFVNATSGLLSPDTFEKVLQARGNCGASVGVATDSQLASANSGFDWTPLPNQKLPNYVDDGVDMDNQDNEYLWDD